MKQSSIFQFINAHKVPVGIGLVWLFHISAVIGIFLGYESWFISLTPLNLLIILFSICWISDFDKSTLLALLIPFFVGMFAEALGVNFGWIFGNYAYGNNLGPKFLGVPWMIGVNWAILVYVTANISRQIHSNILITSAIGALLMTSLDVLLEVSAPRFDYWEFKEGFAPLQNYFGWFGTAMAAHVSYQSVTKEGHFIFSFHVFTVFTLFFTIFLFI
ncbi:carotenoid biosynthesis protein [Ascidiimonas aurantiaca]|uniref:carotenoid biosynthesis protein n=1 Tax=Ascidiimonas aurantiaca TaxID=1685432 RepID=UPI0030EEDAD6